MLQGLERNKWNYSAWFITGVFATFFIAFWVGFQFCALLSALEKGPLSLEKQWLVKVNKVSSQRNESNLIGTLRWTADYTLWSMCSAWDKFAQ